MGEHSSGVSLQGVLGNNPQKLAGQTQGLRLSATLETRFPATTKAPSRRWVRHLGMEDSPGLTEDFISLDNILSGCGGLLGT